ncbi:hypothetical protein ABT160_23540 [Streptomyces sp. NPDC001941]|uniref:hypothetical protein n=1 Tax=Streptomyces sp. NPDC001941 TaxID=3154659 RepID=UPI003328A353
MLAPRSREELRNLAAMRSARLPWADQPWTLTYGGVLLGGASPLVLSEVEGLAAMPDVKDFDLELIGLDGLRPGRDYMRGRTVTMSFQVLADSSEHLDLVMGEVMAAFSHSREERPMRFKFPGVAQGATAEIRGRVRKRSAVMDDMYGVYVPTVDVQFECTSPYVQGVGKIRRRLETLTNYRRGGTEFSDSLGLPVMPLAIPDNGGGEGYETAWVTNGSLEPCDLTVVINGPVAGPRVRARREAETPGGQPWEGIAGVADDVEVQSGERVEFTFPHADGVEPSAAHIRLDGGRHPLTVTGSSPTLAAGRSYEITAEYAKSSSQAAPAGYVEWQPGRYV